MPTWKSEVRWYLSGFEGKGRQFKTLIRSGTLKKAEGDL